MCIPCTHLNFSAPNYTCTWRLPCAMGLAYLMSSGARKHQGMSGSRCDFRVDEHVHVFMNRSCGRYWRQCMARVRSAWKARRCMIGHTSQSRFQWFHSRLERGKSDLEETGWFVPKHLCTCIVCFCIGKWFGSDTCGYMCIDSKKLSKWGNYVCVSRVHAFVQMHASTCARTHACWCIIKIFSHTHIHAVSHLCIHTRSWSNSNPWSDQHSPPDIHALIIFIYAKLSIKLHTRIYNHR